MPSDAQAPGTAATPAASTQPRQGASASAAAPDSEREAEAARRLWPSAPPAVSAGSAQAFVAGLGPLIVQFRSLAADISAGSGPEEAVARVTRAAHVKLTRAAQALVLVLADPAAVWANAADGSSISPRAASDHISGALASAQRLSAPGLAPVQMGGAKRAVQKTSVVMPRAADPTVAGWLPSAAGVAFGTGTTGAAAPAAALLAVFAVCLLGTWLPRRLADDGLACKSALLNMRLERPG